MKYRLTIVVDIDEESLSQHDGDNAPPPNNVRDWYTSDLFEAYRNGWVDAGFDVIEDIQRTP